MANPFVETTTDTPARQNDMVFEAIPSTSTMAWSPLETTSTTTQPSSTWSPGDYIPSPYPNAGVGDGWNRSQYGPNAGQGDMQFVAYNYGGANAGQGEGTQFVAYNYGGPNAGEGDAWDRPQYVAYGGDAPTDRNRDAIRNHGEYSTSQTTDAAWAALAAGVPVIADLGFPACTNCRIMAPLWNQVHGGNNLNGQAAFLSINTDRIYERQQGETTGGEDFRTDSGALARSMIRQGEGFPMYQVLRPVQDFNAPGGIRLERVGVLSGRQDQATFERFFQDQLSNYRP
jgi:hypothetical protein